MFTTVEIEATTDSGGDAVVTTDLAYTGYLEAVEYVVGSFATGVDATLKVVNRASGVERTLLTLTDANANAFHQVRRLAQDNAGADLTTEVVYVRDVVDGTLELTIAQGGNAQTGRVIVFIGKLP